MLLRLAMLGLLATSGAFARDRDADARRIGAAPVEAPPPPVVRCDAAFEAFRVAPTPLTPDDVARLRACIAKPYADTDVAERPALPSERVETTLSARVDLLRECYVRELGHDEGTAGELRIRLAVDPEGKVLYAGAAPGPLSGRELERCVRVVIQSARFEGDRPQGITIVDYPIRFAVPRPPACEAEFASYVSAADDPARIALLGCLASDHEGEEPRGVGGLEGERLDLEVRRHRSLLYSCYDYGRSVDGLVIRFVIDPVGRVPLARVVNGSGTYATCLENRFRHFEFQATDTHGFVLGEWVDTLR